MHIFLIGTKRNGGGLGGFSECHGSTDEGIRADKCVMAGRRA